MRDRFAKVTKLLKRYPPLFDNCLAMSRLLGYSNPVYETLRKYFLSRQYVQFIQIGANDGISNDPIREFVIRNPEWHGVFVEPLPEFFNQCKYNYSYYKPERFQFIQAAVSESPGSLNLWKIKDTELAKFPLFSRGMASVNPNHIIKHFPNVDVSKTVEKIVVPCITYSALVEQTKFSQVDLLVLDVEGHEPEILQSIEGEKIKPTAILFEISHLDPSNLQDIDSLLKALGYILYPLGVDCFAMHKTLVLD